MEKDYCVYHCQYSISSTEFWFTVMRFCALYVRKNPHMCLVNSIGPSKSSTTSWFIVGKIYPSQSEETEHLVIFHFLIILCSFGPIFIPMMHCLLLYLLPKCQPYWSIIHWENRKSTESAETCLHQTLINGSTTIRDVRIADINHWRFHQIRLASSCFERLARLWTTRQNRLLSFNSFLYIFFITICISVP
jgi:hypothetical protein